MGQSGGKGKARDAEGGEGGSYVALGSVTESESVKKSVKGWESEWAGYFHQEE